MEKRVTIWLVGSLAALLSLASSVFNVLFAYHISTRPLNSALRILLFVAFAISVLNFAGVIYFCAGYTRNLQGHSLGLKKQTWGLFTAGVVIAGVSIAATGVPLVWLFVRQTGLRENVLNMPVMTMLAIWAGLWGATAILQLVFYTLLGLWTKNVLRSQRASRLDMDFGRRVSSMYEVQSASMHQQRPSFNSQDMTLASPPRTPISRGGSGVRRSSSTRVGYSSSRTKLVRPSARSSLEGNPFPAGEAMSIDSAFDDWDTSSVHQEMRYAIHSSPPVTRAGLATIPGSRPESPANALDGPYLPESPLSSSPPHAATSDAATMVGWSSSPRQYKSSPSSSPPNFSRPTSSHKKPVAAPPPKFGVPDSSMHGLIHPLFRPNSPQPPAINSAGTMITASPMADHLITPKTLAKLRSESSLRRRSQSVYDEGASKAGTPEPSEWVEDSLPDSPTLGSSPSLGSPGPSVVDEAELPPILPGFILSAGTRSSLVEYGKRKGLNNQRHRSQLSAGDRLS
ncbi:hypothetical protein PV10_07098 [Exophiala mesophila]|uniref:Uncharacterized protein n=1 Tax=Exophiala mesophila TaxID=212818 RepID=A0A0D1ZSD2_EXOME|nr:uncharacterized protein PV10_07098 [Exophiala mesophila]KIV89718.1 hypothetical protein PV10_07098 [Exophiala mesophila]